MIVKIFFTNTFADGLFSGERVAVVVLRHLGREPFLQALTEEMKMPVTAFLLPYNGDFMVRFFTPSYEISFSDAGSLATAHILYSAGLTPTDQKVQLNTKSGPVVVQPGFKPGELAIAIPPQVSEKLEPDFEQKLLSTLGLPYDDPQTSILKLGDKFVVCSSKAFNIAAPHRAFFELLPVTAKAFYSAPLGEFSSTASYSISEISGKTAELDLDLQSIIAPYWSKHLKETQFEVHYQTARYSLIKTSITPTDIIFSGQVLTLMKAEPELSELKGETATAWDF